MKETKRDWRGGGGVIFCQAFKKHKEIKVKKIKEKGTKKQKCTTEKETDKTEKSS